jgi:hypothetical protein
VLYILAASGISDDVVETRPKIHTIKYQLVPEQSQFRKKSFEGVWQLHIQDQPWEFIRTNFHLISVYKITNKKG